MSSKIDELITNIDQYLINPTKLQQTIMDYVKDTSEGQYEFVDATNPVVNVIEAAVMTSAATFNSFNSVLRKQYPSLAQNYDDIFRHMCDEDYLNRFAVPATATMNVMFRKDELINKMRLDSAKGYSKIVIPADTYFTVAETTFMALYPIEIRKLAHGGLQIVFNNDNPSPMLELPTNYIDWSEKVDNADNRYIYLEIPVTQVSVSSKIIDASSSIKFTTNFKLDNSFYYARVFIRQDDDSWDEIKTTHSAVVYDLNHTTAVLKVTDDILNVSIPDIYIKDFHNSRKVRIDIYETLGPVNMMLGQYAPETFEVKWQSLDDNKWDQYVSPLTTIETILIFSTSVVSGGRRGLTFEELRERVISNAVGNPTIPVSNVQIQTSLEDANYEVIKNIDNVTNRVFLATRFLPRPQHQRLITAANISIQSTVATMVEQSGISTVADNGESITILSGTVFEKEQGKLSIISDYNRDLLHNSPSDQLVSRVNSRELYYTPFHYVLDASEDIFDFRPYYLDNPSVINKKFIAENDTNGFQANVGGVSIYKKDYGFRLEVQLKSSTEFKELDDDLIFLQLRFKPKGEESYAYINGELIGFTETNERIYLFEIETTWKINKDNHIEITNFNMFSDEEKKVFSKLEHDFEILIAHTHPVDINFRRNEVDQALGYFLLPPDIYGVINEGIKIKFGYFLDKLWARSRSVVSAASYARHNTDKLATYTSNVYEINPDNGTTIFIENGVPIRKLVHAVGDPIIIDNEQQYVYRKGDIVLDSDGKPTIDKPRNIYRDCDYLLIEGAYYYAKDTISDEYRKEMTETLVSWITNGLEDISTKLIEQTRIYFYPKSTIGEIEVMVGDGQLDKIKAAQSFILTLHVNDIVFKNNDLKNELRVKSIETINDQLRGSVVTVSGIIKALKDVYGNDVIDVEVKGLGSNNNLHALTIMNDTERLSIKKVLKNLPDNNVIVEEAVDLIFIRHELV